MLNHKRLVVLLSLTTLLFLSSISLTFCDKISKNNIEDDEDLSFLEEPEDASTTHHGHANYPDPDNFGEEDEDDDGDDFGDFSGYDPQSEDEFNDPEVDEKDVVVLIERNFTTVIENNQFVLVEFYAPWCGHCQALAPEYAAAATELKKDGVVLAKVDASLENELAHEYDVQGFPTIYFFVDGVHKPYSGQRTK